MADKRKPEYWRSYRKIRSNVKAHLSAIYGDTLEIEEQPICSSSTDGREEYDQFLSPLAMEQDQSTHRQTPFSGPSSAQEAFDTRVISLLEEIHENMKENRRLLELLLARSTDTEEEPQPYRELPEGVELPLNTVEELAYLEKKLSDQEFCISMVQYLATCGGHTVAEATSRILRQTMTNNLAKLYNLKGMKGKRKFEDLRFFSVIFKCLQMNSSTRSATKKDLEVSVSKWLAGTRDRAGGRNERARMSAAKESASTSMDEH